MKNVLLIFLSIFIILGCSSNKEVFIKSSFQQTQKQEYKQIESNNNIQQKSSIVYNEQPQSNEEKFIEEVEETTKDIIVKDHNENKIAILFPSTIVGKYAKTTINTLNAFLLYKNISFKVETFDTFDENEKNINKEIDLINKKGYKNVIAMFTSDGFEVLNKISESNLARYYFPLINKSEISETKDNFIFGGISYENQFDLLSTYSNDNNTMFYVNSYLGNKLRNLYEKTFLNIGKIKEIQTQNNRYEEFVEDESMSGNTVILNTPIVKTSIILNQLTAFEIEPNIVLSTQLNYNPILVKLTQQKDRKNFLVVSSISKVNDFLEEYTNILDSDIVYNWVDYSSLVGVNYLLFNGRENSNSNTFSTFGFQQKNRNLNNKKTDIKTKIIDNQAQYESTIYEATSYGFKKLEIN